MLKLNPDPTFEAEVAITVPGQEETGTVPLTFKYRGKKEFTDWIESMKELKDGKGKVTRKEKTTTEAFLEYVDGWGLSEKFTKENVDIFLDNYPMAYNEIFVHYTKSLLGSRVKN